MLLRSQSKGTFDIMDMKMILRKKIAIRCILLYKRRNTGYFKCRKNVRVIKSGHLKIGCRNIKVFSWMTLCSWRQLAAPK